MMWIRFAWKNVWRNYRRSVTTMLITATGSFALLIFSGYMLFTFQSLAEMAARQNGNLVISDPNYFTNDEPTPMAYGMKDWRKVRKQAGKLPGVKRVLPRIHFSGLISNGEKSMIFVGSGVDPDHEFDLQGPFLDVREGELLDPKAAMPEVVLGVALARSLNVGPGAVLTILGTTSDGALNGLDVRLAGTIATGVPDMDKRTLIVTLATAQEILATDRVSTLCVYLYKMERTQIVRAQILQMNEGVGVKPWYELAFFYHKVRALYSGIFGVIGIVILVVVLLSVANTMSMAVVERTREIGVMSAMGTFPGQILLNFVFESMIIGLMGAGLGFLFASSLTVALPYAHIMMPPPPGRNVGYPLMLNFSASACAAISCAIVLITTMGGLMAARKGVKKSIVEALSHV